MTTLMASVYSHQHYDSLPDIMVAADALTSTSALDRMGLRIGSIFVKHGVQNHFGLCLLHRHFDMDPAERLVAFGNVSVPWDTVANEASTNQIHPSAWRFLSDNVVPYEFASGKTTTLPVFALYDAFVEELGAFLRDNHLDDLFGICLIDPEAQTGMEFTSGRANVTVPDVLWTQNNDNKFVEASWQFETSDGCGNIVFKKCKNKCEYKAATKSHAERHLTTNK